MKSYLPTHSVLAEIERALANNHPSFHKSPLDLVTELLSEGRNYSWVGIYLKLDEQSSPSLLQQAASPHPGQLALAGTKKKIIVTMKVAGREVGFLNVESDRANAFGSADRVLLDRVAGLLARFLSSRGKYLVRKAVRPTPAPKAAAA